MRTASAFGNALRILRQAKGWSLRDLVEHTSLDHAYVHRLERGAKAAPSIGTIVILLARLGPTKHEANALYFLAGYGVDIAELDRDTVLRLTDTAPPDTSSPEDTEPRTPRSSPTTKG